MPHLDEWRNRPPRSSRSYARDRLISRAAASVRAEWAQPLSVTLTVFLLVIAPRLTTVIMTLVPIRSRRLRRLKPVRVTRTLTRVVLPPACTRKEEPPSFTVLRRALERAPSAGTLPVTLVLTCSPVPGPSRRRSA